MTRVSIDSLADAIGEALGEYADWVFNATEEGLDKAEKILINNLKAKSPKDSGGYQESWKSKGKKYKLQRFVGNTKTVKTKKRGEIPLSNVLEYSPMSKHQGLIKRIYESSINEMAAAVVAEIKKGG